MYTKPFLTRDFSPFNVSPPPKSYPHGAQACFIIQYTNPTYLPQDTNHDHYHSVLPHSGYHGSLNHKTCQATILIAAFSLPSPPLFLIFFICTPPYHNNDCLFLFLKFYFSKKSITSRFLHHDKCLHFRHACFFFQHV